MKQLLQDLRNGETRIADVPVPQPRPGTVLVRTAASLVSAGTERTLAAFAEKSLVGKARSRPDLVRQVVDKARREGLLTTLEAALNRLDQPMPLGYSSAGTVAAVGDPLPGTGHSIRVGDRVACAGGGHAVHAEYALIPLNLLSPIPPEVDFEAAAFTTLGAIALHGLRLSQPQVGERVAVIGLGLLGLLTVGIARAAGCAVLGIDLDPGRVELARALGAEAVLRPEAEQAAQAFSRSRGCDAVLICADTRSNDPVKLAGVIARDRAHVIAVGAVDLSIPRKQYYEKELSLVVSRSYGPGRYDNAYEEQGRDYPLGYVRWTEGRNLEAVLDLMARRQLDVHPLITHRFPIDQASQAYDLITGKTHEPYLGVLITYPAYADTPSGEEAGRKTAPSPGAASLTRPPSPAASLTGRGGEILAPHAGSTAMVTPPTAGRMETVDGKASPGATLGIGVLGAGNYASATFLPAVQAALRTGHAGPVKLQGIASATGLSAQHAARRYGFAFATSQECDVLDDPAVRVVAILTRHNQHARQVSEGLERGKAVFCEKPLAITASELDQVADLLRWGEPPLDNTPLLTVGFNRRFAPLAVKLKTFLENRTEPLAAHYRINAGFLPLDHWLHDPSQGGGRIIGEGCHFVDFLTFLAGSPPASVWVQGLPDAGRYSEDNVTLNLSFPDGSLGVVTYLANGDKSLPKERLEVFCGGRVGILDDFRTLELVSRGRRERIPSRLSAISNRQNKGHRAGWEAFLSAVRQGGPPPIPYEHLLGVTRATFAAVESLRTGERVWLQNP